MARARVAGLNHRQRPRVTRPKRAREAITRSRASPSPRESGAVRWFDRPVARIGAAVALVISLLTLVATWPESWWPRSAPPLSAVVVNDPTAARLYATPKNAEEIEGAPAATTPPGGYSELDGCGSRERHSWARRTGAIPAASAGAEVRVILTTLWSRPTVVVTDVRPVVQRLPQRFITAIDLCPPSQSMGDGVLLSQTAAITLADEPEITLYGEKGVEVERLSLEIPRGEAAELILQPYVENLGTGVGYSWHAELDVLVDGDLQTLRIPEEGEFYLAEVAWGGRFWSDLATPSICTPEVDDWCT